MTQDPKDKYAEVIKSFREKFVRKTESEREIVISLPPAEFESFLLSQLEKQEAKAEADQWTYKCSE